MYILTRFSILKNTPKFRHSYSRGPDMRIELKKAVVREFVLKGTGWIWILLLCLPAGGCGPRKIVREIRVTAYCGCGQCCGWERGSWKYLKLDLWNKYISTGPSAGKPYSGLTASGTSPHEPRFGLLTLNSIAHPWMIPFRIIFPWLWFSRDGTLAADTRVYPFGTRMYIPGYGYGIVEDRGSAIKGPHKLDIFFDSHSAALEWGVRHLEVVIY